MITAKKQGVAVNSTDELLQYLYKVDPLVLTANTVIVGRLSDSRIMVDLVWTPILERTYFAKFDISACTIVVFTLRS